MREDDRYYLTAPEIDNPAQPDKFTVAAQRLIELINGLARARHCTYRPVSLSGHFTDDNGNITICAPAAHLEIRVALTADGVVLGPDGKPKPEPPSPWPDRLALAATNPDVAEALKIMGRAEQLNWDDLWKLFEIMREAVKQDTIVTLGWTTAADLDAFKESANRQDVSGEAARHARRPGQPQHRAMPLAEARSYVSDLVIKWLGKLAGNS